MKVMLRAFIRHPWFGTGLGSFHANYYENLAWALSTGGDKYADPPASFFLMIASELGLAGVVVILVGCWLLARASRLMLKASLGGGEFTKAQAAWHCAGAGILVICDQGLRGLQRWLVKPRGKTDEASKHNATNGKYPRAPEKTDEVHEVNFIVLTLRAYVGPYLSRGSTAKRATHDDLNLLSRPDFLNGHILKPGSASEDLKCVGAIFADFCTAWTVSQGVLREGIKCAE